MADSPTTIHAFPELRKLAEQQALSLRSALWDANPGPAVVPSQKAMTEAVLTRLCDMTDPASRDALGRLIGARVGWDGPSVVLSVETGGINVHALFRACGFEAESAPAVDLVLVVRHLWPEPSDAP